MDKSNKNNPEIKLRLHPRSDHRGRYNFTELVAVCSDLKEFIGVNKYGNESIDFFNPDAVRALNKSLLMYYYDIQIWDLPKGYLCPPIPGRADYIHYMADVLASVNNNILPVNNKIRCLDIGTGSSCIYPIIGTKLYEWNFVGSDIDQEALNSANEIIQSNLRLKDQIELRWQQNKKDIFHGVIKKEEYFDLTICNPPFHTSMEEAQIGTLRKLKNIKKKKVFIPELNFGGQPSELWCDGGERVFILDMIRQSKQLSKSCLWFSTLVSKESNLKGLYKALKSVHAVDVRIVVMGQGNKSSRVLAWTFFSKKDQKEWISRNW